MSKESETAATKRTLVGVVLAKPIAFFNLFGDRISSTMQGVTLRWTGDKVIVTHEQFPTEERWIFPGSITSLAWKNE